MLTWPVTVREERADGTVVVLRPLSRDDRGAWELVRSRDREWLRPWESTVPTGVEPAATFRQMRRGFERAARAGRVLPFAIEADGRFAGQMHLFDIQWGSRWTASAGYWLDRTATRRGVATWALAMLVDHALLQVGLHRVEVNIRPENHASLAVVRRLGLPEEGLRRGLIHVDGQWRDHLTFVVTSEQLAASGPLVDRLHIRHTGHFGDTPPSSPEPA